jgi:hypothetical protein
MYPTDPAHERAMGERRRAVKAAMEHAWSNYVEHAWGHGMLLWWCVPRGVFFFFFF